MANLWRSRETTADRRPAITNNDHRRGPVAAISSLVPLGDSKTTPVPSAWLALTATGADEVGTAARSPQRGQSPKAPSNQYRHPQKHATSVMGLGERHHLQTRR